MAKRNYPANRAKYSRPRKRGGMEDGPDKTVQINGKLVPLIKRTRAARLWGYSTQSLRMMERDGDLPEPMFCYGDKRYYSTYEVDALRSLHYSFGKPNRHSKMAANFLSAVRDKWREIRTAIFDGADVESSVVLRFPSNRRYAEIVAMCAGRSSDEIAEILSEFVTVAM